MSEFLGYAYFTEIPAVVVNVQRCGPSTGMPTRTQQADIMACAYASHGDTRHVLLFPANPEECFYLAVQAFDLAERLQTPVIMLTDLDIGMNDWMCRDLNWDDDYRPDRGKVLSAEELEDIEVYHRYFDTDGDGIRVAHAAGRPPERRLFHARLGPQHVRRLHRGFRRIPGSRRPAAAQVGNRQALRAGTRDPVLPTRA